MLNEEVVSTTEGQNMKSNLFTGTDDTMVSGRGDQYLTYHLRIRL